MSRPSWKPVRVCLAELKPWERNPRQMTKAAAERLLRGWEELGQVQTVAIGPNGEVYDGHQRLSALLSAYGPDYEIIALQSDRQLTESERERVTLLLHAGAVGQWDWDELSSWPEDALRDSGFDEELLRAWESDVAALREFINSSDDGSGIEYVNTAQIPIYEPPADGRVPEPDELVVNCEEVDALVELVEALDVPEEYRRVFRLAAYRFARIDFRRMADYYALADPAVRDVMERLALVIVDVDRAIEVGLIKLTNRLREILLDEHGDMLIELAVKVHDILLPADVDS